MKNHYLPKSTNLIVLILFLVFAFTTNAIAQDELEKTQDQIKKTQKYDGPLPCASVNSHNGSLIPVGSYVFINKYFNTTKDQLFTDSDEIDFPETPGARAFYYEELQTAFRTGIVKGVDVRLIFSLFEKKLDRKLPTSNVTDINSGLGDAKLFARYGILSQKTGPFNLIAGVGSTIPLGSTDATDNLDKLLPGSLQLGSGSWNPLFEIGMHKIIKHHWISGYFMYMMAMEGELGADAFTRPNVLKYNFAYAYALSHMFDIGAEINCEMTSKAQMNGNDIDNTGGHVIFFTPEVHFKFARFMHFDLSYAIPVHQDLNGPQLGYTSSIVVKLAMKF